MLQRYPPHPSGTSSSQGWPSRALAVSQQGQGAAPRLWHPRGAAGTAGTEHQPRQEPADAEGGRGETAQAAQMDCDSPRKAEPGGAEKIQVSFLFLTICSPSAVGGRIITAIHHAALACHTGCAACSAPRAQREELGFAFLGCRFGFAQHQGKQKGREREMQPLSLLSVVSPPC